MVASNHPNLIPAESPVAVGLRGNLLYGAALTGKAGAEEPDASPDDDDALLPFFAKPEPETVLEPETVDESED